MLSTEDAARLVDKHLGASPRAAHSHVVAAIMRLLAGRFNGDGDTWETVGLCHDLDFFETSADPARHGLLTIEWLGERLSVDARQAIAAHDHRTGIAADTMLADMLKLADVIAVIDERLGRRAVCEIDRADPYGTLRSQLKDRPYLCDILQNLAGKHSLPFSRIVEIVRQLG